MQREQKTTSGPLLEIDFYPVFEDGRRIPTRAPKTKPTSAQQKKYNDTQATKKFIRLANANFDNTDFLMHPTYSPSKSPQTEQEARRDIVNYLRRVKTRRASELRALNKSLAEAAAASEALPNNEYLKQSIEELKRKIKKLEEPFRYIYVIEKQVYKTGSRAGLANYHFHLFITGGLNSKVLESMWKNGSRSNCNNFQPERFGPEAAAAYMSKDPQGSKRFSYSRNLKQPKKKAKDGRLTRRGVERLAKLRVDDRAYWENRYKGYRFLRCYARCNPYNGHWYVTAIMYKSSEKEPPTWTAEDWLTEDF